MNTAEELIYLRALVEQHTDKIFNLENEVEYLKQRMNRLIKLFSDL